MRTIKEVRLTESLPESLLRDEQIAAMASALDGMLADLSADAAQVLHLPRLEELSGTILDLLAWQFHVDFYEPLWLSDEVKRNLIRQSIAWHRIKGTRAAVEQVNAAFNRAVEISEWYEYGGEPYWFRLRTAPFRKKSEMDSWFRQLSDAKNVRSWCEVIFEVKIETPLYVGIGRFAHGKMRRLMTKRYTTTRLSSTMIDGSRTLTVSATQVIIKYGDDEEIIPLGSLFGDLLKMRFTSPTSDRILTVPNPREDLTADEVQEVADFITENKILLNSAGEATSDIKRATILTTTTQILF